MINLHQLRIFVVIVEQRSFTRAAERLHLTQPAVSAQIRHLHAFVGAPVLTRDGRRVVPTEAGLALYQYAREVLGVTDALQRDLTEINSGELEHIVVGGARAYGTYVLPPLLSRFHNRHPKLRLSLLDAASDEVVEDVHAGEIDLGVVLSERIPKELRQELGTTHLYDDELIIVESAEHPVSRDQALSLEEVANVPFVRTLLGGATPGTALDNLLSAAGFRPHRVLMDLGTWEGTKEAVRAGVGLAITFELVVRRELATGELHIVHVEGYRDVRGVGLIISPHRRRGRQSLVFQELLTFLRNEVPRALWPTTHGNTRHVTEPPLGYSTRTRSRRR